MSRRLPQLDDRKMPAPLEEADSERDGCALFGPQRDPLAQRPPCATLEARPVASGGNLEVRLVRSRPAEPRVRPVDVVPSDEELDLAAHRFIAAARRYAEPFPLSWPKSAVTAMLP